MLGVTFLRLESFVGQGCSILNATLLKSFYLTEIIKHVQRTCCRAGALGVELGFLKSPSTPIFKECPDWEAGGEQRKIDSNASNPACSGHREERGPKEVGMKELLILTGSQAGLQRGGRCRKVCLPTPPRSPSARLDVQEEVCSKEL